MTTRYLSPLSALCFLIILFTIGCTPSTMPVSTLTATKPALIVTNTLVLTATATLTITPTATPSVTPYSAKVSCFSESSSNSAIWSPDGTWIAITSLAGVYVFDFNLSNGKLFATKEPPVAITPDPAGDSFYVAIGDEIIRVNRNTQEAMQVIKMNGESPNTILISEDGSKVLTAEADQGVTIRDIESGKVLAKNNNLLSGDPILNGSGGANVVAAPDFSWVAFEEGVWDKSTGTSSGQITLWNPISNIKQILTKVNFGGSGNTAIAASVAGEFIIAPNGFNKISVIRVKNGSIINTFYGEAPFSISANGTVFAFTRLSGKYETWLAETIGQPYAIFTPSFQTPPSKDLIQLGPPKPVLNPDGSRMALLWNGAIEVIETKTRNAIRPRISSCAERAPNPF